MVRIACLISGVPRSFQTNLWPFLLEVFSQLPPEHSLHLFFSFPKSSNADRFLNTYDSIHETLLHHPNVKTIQYEENCPDILYKMNPREQNIVTQWYRLQTLFSLLPKESYDIILRCRPDIQFSCTANDFISLFLKNIELNTVYIPSGFDIYDHKLRTYLTQPTINDQVAWGSYTAMKIYCSVYTSIQTYKPTPLISEAALYLVLKESSLHITRVTCPYNLRISQCFSFAICGESGAGKSTLSKLLQEILPFDQTLLLETDRYHKWERGAKEYQTYTHYHPEANHLEKLAEDAYSLHLGEDIFTVDYDHDTGKFTEPHHIESANYMILCGLHTLYKDSIRDFVDLKIYLDTEESLTQEWKIERDMKERGASRETILQAIEKRRDDFLKYIAPQKEHADILIQFCKESENIHLRIGIQNEKLLSIATNILIKYCPFVSKESSIHWFTCTTPPSIEVVSTDAKTLGYSGKLPLAQGFNGLLQLLCICLVWKPLTTT
jgi:uridine kinase